MQLSRMKVVSAGDESESVCCAGTIARLLVVQFITSIVISSINETSRMPYNGLSILKIAGANVLWKIFINSNPVRPQQIRLHIIRVARFETDRT